MLFHRRQPQVVCVYGWHELDPVGVHTLTGNLCDRRAPLHTPWFGASRYTLLVCITHLPQDPAARSVVRYIETQLVVADPATGEPTFEADQDRLARWVHVY